MKGTRPFIFGERTDHFANMKGRVPFIFGEDPATSRPRAAVSACPKSVRCLSADTWTW